MSPVRRVACAALVSFGGACGTAASASLEPDAFSAIDAAKAEAGCSPAGSVPGCPCDLPIPGTVTHVGDIACASGVGPAVVACGKKAADGGVAFPASDASVWVPFFICSGEDSCSAVTTYDEFTCKDPSTGVLTYLAILGAPCFNTNEGACSLDQDTVMVCKAGLWTSFATCANHSCVDEGQRPACGPS